MFKFVKAFNELNNITTKRDLKKAGLQLVDLEYCKATFYMLQTSYNANNGARATAKTLLKSVADFYNKHGFNISHENGVYLIEYVKE